MIQGLVSSVGIYRVNPESSVYALKRVRQLMDIFYNELTVPYKEYNIQMPKVLRPDIKAIKPLEHPLSIVILPTTNYHFEVFEQAQKVVLMVSMHPGNGMFSFGISYPALTLIRYYLLQKRELVIDKRPWVNIKHDGKVIILASLNRVESLAQLKRLKKCLKRMQVESRRKSLLLRILKMKERQYILKGGS